MTKKSYVAPNSIVCNLHVESPILAGSIKGNSISFSIDENEGTVDETTMFSGKQQSTSGGFWQDYK